MAQVTLANTPSGQTYQLAKAISASGATPEIKFSGDDPTLDIGGSLPTALIVHVTIELNDDGSSKSEAFFVDTPVDNGDGTYSFTTVVRALKNDVTNNPAVVGDSKGSGSYKSHKVGAAVVLDPTITLRNMESTYDAGTTVNTAEAGETVAIIESLALHTDAKLYLYHATNYPNLVGVANSLAASGAQLTYTTFGGVSTGHTGLTVGATQYAENTGAITETSSITTKVLGVAETATSIRLYLAPTELEKASQAEAEAGTDNLKYMTSLRAKQAIDSQVLGIGLFSAINNGGVAKDKLCYVNSDEEIVQCTVTPVASSEEAITFSSAGYGDVCRLSKYKYIFACYETNDELFCGEWNPTTKAWTVGARVTVTGLEYGLSLFREADDSFFVQTRDHSPSVDIARYTVSGTTISLDWNNTGWCTSGEFLSFGGISHDKSSLALINASGANLYWVIGTPSSGATVTYRINNAYATSIDIKGAGGITSTTGWALMRSNLGLSIVTLSNATTTPVNNGVITDAHTSSGLGHFSLGYDNKYVVIYYNTNSNYKYRIVTMTAGGASLGSAHDWDSSITTPGPLSAIKIAKEVHNDDFTQYWVTTVAGHIVKIRFNSDLDEIIYAKDIVSSGGGRSITPAGLEDITAIRMETTSTASHNIYNILGNNEDKALGVSRAIVADGESTELTILSGKHNVLTGAVQGEFPTTDRSMGKVIIPTMAIITEVPIDFASTIS